MKHEGSASTDWKSPPKFTLVCERRDDGGLRVTCPEVPGLVLSSSSVFEPLRAVMPAIDLLVTHNK